MVSRHKYVDWFRRRSLVGFRKNAPNTKQPSASCAGCRSAVFAFPPRSASHRFPLSRLPSSLTSLFLSFIPTASHYGPVSNLHVHLEPSCVHLHCNIKLPSYLPSARTATTGQPVKQSPVREGAGVDFITTSKSG